MNAPTTLRRTFQLDLTARGYQVLFRPDEVNRCPGCTKVQWLVGRTTAECAVCGTALSIAEAQLGGHNPAGQRAVALHIVAAAGALAVFEQRQHERVGAGERVLALHLDGSPHPFSIHNISAGGIMGDALPAIAEAQSIAVELEDGTLIPAELKWTDGTMAGLAFLTPRDG